GAAHEGLLAGAPGDNAVRPERDAVDPAVLCVRGERLAPAVRIGRHDLAVIAAGEHARTVAGRRQDAAAVHGEALFRAVLGKQQRFLAEHEYGGTFEEMHGDDRPARRDWFGAI